MLGKKGLGVTVSFGRHGRPLRSTYRTPPMPAERSSSRLRSKACMRTPNEPEIRLAPVSNSLHAYAALLSITAKSLAVALALSLTPRCYNGTVATSNVGFWAAAHVS